MRIGRYDVEGEIARGGMGVVFSGVDPLMKRKVAIKILKPKYSEDEEIRTRFEHEVEAVAALEHPNIVPIYDFGEHDGQLYYVMRSLPGGTLRDRIRARPLTLRELAPIINRLAEALDAVHERGVLHRDIKPANVLFDDADKAYLSDFGIAKMPSLDKVTQSQVVVGTPAYMSPEQARGEEIDARCDVYALAGMTFHALTGRKPYQRRSPLATAMAHISDPIPSARDVIDRLPAAVDDVFKRGMAKSPADRYPTAGAFAAAFGQVASGRWFLNKLPT